MITEFDIIQRYFKNSLTNVHTILGIGDDAAISQIPEGYELITSIDTLNIGVHFPENTAPFDIGYKALAVSLSDMAAMGAEPIGFLLSLTLPQADTAWLAEFSRGLFTLAYQHNVPLIGGDTTKGPLSISTIVQGITPKASAICRHGANIGDLIFVTGSLGDAGLALQLLQTKNIVPSKLLTRLNQPTPRLTTGIALRNIATAAIDISDGLAADLTHLIQASNVGAEIQTEKIPLSIAIKENADLLTAYRLALSSGDDYEICFTAAASQIETIQQIALTTACPIKTIGKITRDSHLIIYDDQQQPLKIDTLGYHHF